MQEGVTTEIVWRKKWRIGSSGGGSQWEVCTEFVSERQADVTESSWNWVATAAVTSITVLQKHQHKMVLAQPAQHSLDDHWNSNYPSRSTTATNANMMMNRSWYFSAVSFETTGRQAVQQNKHRIVVCVCVQIVFRLCVQRAPELPPLPIDMFDH